MTYASLKYVWSAGAILAVVFAGIWTYGWYTGKIAPSVADSEVVERGMKTAYFAGGCFWCTESDFEKYVDAESVVSGYMGGDVDNPTYSQVARGETGHREAVKVVYDPQKISYRQLVLILLGETDPTDIGGSFYDRGHQYTSAVYYQDDDEKERAEEVIRELETAGIFGSPIVTSVEKAGTFWVAEDYHQNYHSKNPLQYAYYRNASGRDAYIASVWEEGVFSTFFDKYAVERIVGEHDWKNFKKPSDAQLQNSLTEIQYYVTQKEGTEAPFNNEYWDNHEEGIYVDVVSGEPLFSSLDKYDSGTGWPSFLRPIEYSFVTESQDYSLIIPRTEIRSVYADSHLGHIILDGPEENNKIRYCMNSAALRFIPKENLEIEGYGQFLSQFGE